MIGLIILGVVTGFILGMAYVAWRVAKDDAVIEMLNVSNRELHEAALKSEAQRKKTIQKWEEDHAEAQKLRNAHTQQLIERDLEMELKATVASPEEHQDFIVKEWTRTEAILREAVAEPLPSTRANARAAVSGALWLRFSAQDFDAHAFLAAARSQSLSPRADFLLHGVTHCAGPAGIARPRSTSFRPCAGKAPRPRCGPLSKR